MLTEQQKRWAAQHDWYVRRDADDNIVVVDRWVHNGTLYEHTMPWLRSFKELRDWAGY